MRRPPERSGSSQKKPTQNVVRSLDERRAQKAAKAPRSPKAPPARGRQAPGRTGVAAVAKKRGVRVSREQRKEIRSTIKRFTNQSRGRRAVVFTFLGSFAALLLLVIATLTTPLIAVEKVRITGLNVVSEKQVRKALGDQIGVPLSLINQQHIVDELSGFKRIESVSVVAELPHTLHVAIVERSPISIVVVGGVAYLYDLAGIRLGTARPSDMYPLISSSGEPATSASFKEAIDVLLALPATLS